MVAAALLGFTQPDLVQAAAAFSEGASPWNAGAVVEDSVGFGSGAGLAAALAFQTSFLPLFTHVKVLLPLEIVFPAGEQAAPAFGAAASDGDPPANNVAVTIAAVMIPDICFPQRMSTPNLRLGKYYGVFSSN
ncbi:MAG: hypothetical protein RIR34_387 [Actinomycetota bacterium]